MNKTKASHFEPFGQDDSSGTIWVTSFSEGALKEFTRKFLTLEASGVDMIPIVVSSWGGGALNMAAMRDLIKSSDKQVAILALGKAMSAGCFLLAAGSKGLRFVAPNASVMLHEVRGGGDTGKITDQVVNIEQMKKTHELFMKNFAADTGRSVEQWNADLDKRNRSDWYMTAEEAVALGIADHVDIPRMVSPPSRPQLVSFTQKEEAPPVVIPATPKKKTKKRK